MRKYFEQFQHHEYDNDLIGMTVAIVDWLKYLIEQGAEQIEITQPERFTKRQPHLPPPDRRDAVKDMLADALRSDEEFVINNTYVGLIATTFVYNFPVEKLVEAATFESFSREQARQILIDDDVAEGILKEDSGKDFTAIYIK
jgi:hypothetical protein